MMGGGRGGGGQKVDIIKIATMFIKTNFKDSKKLKELETANFTNFRWSSQEKTQEVCYFWIFFR